MARTRVSPPSAQEGAPVVRQNVPVSWTQMEQLPISAANMFAFVITPLSDGSVGEFVLNAGYLAPPILTGGTEAMVEQMQALGHVEVKPVARLSFSRARAEELRKVLTDLLAALEGAPR